VPTGQPSGVPSCQCRLLSHQRHPSECSFFSADWCSVLPALQCTVFSAIRDALCSTSERPHCSLAKCPQVSLVLFRLASPSVHRLLSHLIVQPCSHSTPLPVNRPVLLPVGRLVCQVACLPRSPVRSLLACRRVNPTARLPLCLLLARARNRLPRHLGSHHGSRLHSPPDSLRRSPRNNPMLRPRPTLVTIPIPRRPACSPT